MNHEKMYVCVCILITELHYLENKNVRGLIQLGGRYANGEGGGGGRVGLICGSKRWERTPNNIGHAILKKNRG